MSWLERIFRRRHLYDELDEEVREHLEEKTEQLMRLENLSRAEARQAALRAFGNPTLVQTRSREVWQWSGLESFLADLKLALRRLRKAPGFGITVLLTLAIGIGANTAVFSVVDSILLKPLPYPQPEQLVAVWLHAPGAAGLANFAEGLRLSPSMYLTFAEHNRTFQSIGVWISGTANVTGIAQPEEVHTTYISDGVLQTLNVPPTAGRWILTADQVPRSHEVAMLSYGYWQRRFGGDPSVIGRNIQVDSQTREIVGVMPRGFEVVNQDFDLLIPLGFDPRHQILAGFGYNGIARLKPGVTISEADADIARMLDIWMDSWTNNDGGDPHFYETWKISGAIRPMKQEVIGNVGSVLWVVMGTIGVVMLIACTNVANLLLVRAEGRQQELAIRAALGAGRARIAREVLSECVLLALIGGVAGNRDCGGWLAAPGRHRPCEPSAPARDLARCALDCIHARAFAAFGTALRVDRGAQVDAAGCIAGARLRGADGERQPRTAARAQSAGDGASGHGDGAADQRRAHDPHAGGASRRRPRICRREPCANSARRDSPATHCRCADHRARRERHCR